MGVGTPRNEASAPESAAVGNASLQAGLLRGEGVSPAVYFGTFVHANGGVSWELRGAVWAPAGFCGAASDVFYTLRRYLW